ncbi:MAG: 4-hydroxythreonine-4-phosphate dehydrogenase PdxA, partial [Hyphomonadaceae bacterium]
MSNPAPLAVSMGDPAGVGLEIAVKAYAARDSATPDFFIVGDRAAVARAASRAGVSAQGLQVEHTPLAMVETPGAPDPVNNHAVLSAIERGVSACANGRACALVTLPIAKAVLYESNFPFPGHTEYLADLTKDMPMEGERGPVMMLAAQDLRVSLVTIHTALARAPALLSVEKIVSVGRVTAQALRQRFGIANPRIALAGLNPHAGEGGALGREEIDIINPAAARLRAEGIDATDALSADTLFHAEARARYDAALAMYHDQGLIPVKTLDFWGGVNVTVGLPIIRTSPDHGAGFDIAGRGLARPDSF